MGESEDFEQVVDVDLLGTMKAMAAETGTWKAAICELVDNGYDQEARTLTVSIDGATRTFEVEDDGAGCSDLSLLVGLGRRKQTMKRPLGMYGWGAKRALLFIAHDVSSILHVESHYKGERLLATTPFEQIGRRRAFSVNRSPSLGHRKGTRIQLRRFKRPHVPTGKELGPLLTELGFTYSLAIEEGRHLIVNDITKRRRDQHVVTAYEPPSFQRDLEVTFALTAKRSVRLRVGVVSSGAPNPRAGLHYRYGYRVIEASSSKGCGDYSVSRIFGYVDLIGDWKLAALKDEIYQPGSLHNEILRRLEPLLKLAQQQQMEVESRAIVASAERMLNEALEKTKRARRPGKRGKAKATPTNTGKQHEDAKVKQPGSAMSGDSPRGRVHLDFAELDTDAVGDVVGNTIRLNTKVDKVVRSRAVGDSETIYMLAMFVWFMRRDTDGHFDARLIEKILGNVGRALMRDSGATVDGKGVLLDAAE